MRKTCPICGVVFDTPPTGAKTCSPGCGSKLTGQSRIGKPHPWGAAAKERLASRGQTGNLKLGTSAARLSPKAGPYSTNQEAKVWRLRRLADGQEWTVRNLRKFCRDHPELFAPAPWENAYVGLLQVQASLMGTRKSRNVSRYKGWTLTRPAEKGQ